MDRTIAPNPLTPYDGVRGLLDVDQAATWLGIGRTLLFDELRSGRLRSVKIGRARRIPVWALHEYVETLGRGEPGGAA